MTEDNDAKYLRSVSATTYALYDSENTTRLETPAQFERMLPRADRFLHWLKVHGCEVAPIAELDRLRRRVRALRRLVIVLGALFAGAAVLLALS